MRLDDVQIRAAYDQAAAQYWGIIAQAARLQAEASDSRTLRFPDELLRIAATTPAVAAEMEAEQRQFEARLMSFEATRQIPKQRIAEQQAIAGALQVQQREALFRQSLTLSELSGARELYSKGFATRLRVNQLERSAADSRSQLADLAGRTKLIQETIAQILFEMQSSAKSRQTDIVREQAAMESRLAESAGRLQGARDRLDKRMVRAPEAGTVMNLRFYTIGSNVATGQPVLDLEPLDGRRLIEAGVAPTDIEHVRVGQKVNIRLTAYKAHEVPVLTGRLVYVGADRQMDEHNEPVFKVRAEVDEEALKGLQGVTLYAGMPADVLIIGHERTALAYLIGPIRSSLRHAMREE
jgi:HlyD family type I secretion membrane fusion protein